MKPVTLRFSGLTVLYLALYISYAWLVFYFHGRMPDDTQVTRFTAAEFAPESDSEWKPVTLTHDWRQKNLDITEGWYRFRFELTTLPVTLTSLYIPQLSQNLAVFLNGVEVGNGGSFETPITRNWPRPLIFALAPEFFVQGSNEIVVWLVSEPAGRGVLGDIYLGDRDILTTAYKQRNILKVTWPTASAVVLVIFAILLSSITFRNREDTQYAWLAASMIAMTGHSLPMLMTRIPVPSFYWEWWQHVCIGFSLVCILIFANRFMGVKRDKRETLAWMAVSLLAVVSLLFGLTGNQAIYYPWAGATWGGLSVLLGTFPVYSLTKVMLKDKDPQKIMMLGAGCMMFYFGALDEMFVAGLTSRENGYLVHFASPVVAFVFTAILFSRFVSASQEAAKLNRELESRVRQKTQELELTYNRLKAMEREQLLAQERERFNRDLHDGLGGYLAGALAMAERTSGSESSLVTTLQDATDEMRLMIDSAEASGADLGMIVGTLRPKLERQLNSAGFTLQWEVLDTRRVKELGPSAAMQMVRIAQELVCNAIKHSGGSVVQIRLADSADGGVALSFSDNGTCQRLSRAQGNGMRNLHTRAAKLEAQLLLDPYGELGGLTATLLLPAAGEPVSPLKRVTPVKTLRPPERQQA